MYRDSYSGQKAGEAGLKRHMRGLFLSGYFGPRCPGFPAATNANRPARRLIDSLLVRPAPRTLRQFRLAHTMLPRKGATLPPLSPCIRSFTHRQLPGDQIVSTHRISSSHLYLRPWLVFALAWRSEWLLLWRQTQPFSLRFWRCPRRLLLPPYWFASLHRRPSPQLAHTVLMFPAFRSL